MTDEQRMDEGTGGIAVAAHPLGCQAESIACCIKDLLLVGPTMGTAKCIISKLKCRHCGVFVYEEAVCAFMTLEEYTFAMYNRGSTCHVCTCLVAMVTSAGIWIKVLDNDEVTEVNLSAID